MQEGLLADQNAVPWRAAYWFLRDKGYQEALAFYARIDGEVRPSEEWESLRGKLMARVLSLVHGIRAGQFPMCSADDECTSRCSYSTVCRVHHARSLEKIWEPPHVDIPK